MALKQFLLTSAAISVMTAMPLSATAETAAKEEPARSADDFDAAHGGWSYSGEFEAGWRSFIQRPPKSATPWVSPTNPVGGGDRNNRSKFEEYGRIAPGLYAEYLRMTLQTKDGTYWNELRADHIGNNNQRYVFDFSKAGEHYLTVVWDEIPHLYTTSALSIWNGVGTSNLTTPVAIPGSTLTPLATGSTAAQRQAMTNALAGKAGLIDVGIQRNKGTAFYRWTPDPYWDFKASYSNEKREGTQISGVYLGGSPAATNAQQMQAPRPIDDTTQIGKLTGQYFGPTPWGGRYNVQLGGGFSLYDNSFNSFTVQNPFYDAANPRLFSPAARISLMPSNQAYNTNITSGIDLPFKTRWNSTLQYTTMRQNDPFIPFTVNPSITTFALPASSLNGEVNTLLYNTVATTQWTPEFKTTTRYRYYDNNNQTPELLMPSYVVEDSSATGIASGVPRRALSMSYTKQNAAAEMQWRPERWVTLGGSAAWEQWDRSRRDADVTNEFIGRLTADFRIHDVATLRTSGQYSERRYNNYDGQQMSLDTYYLASNTGTSFLMRKFDMANRDQLKANAFLDISGPSGSVFRDFVVSPTAGLRFDDYPDDPRFFGLRKTHTWNAGIDATYTFAPGNWIQASYLYETYDRFQIGSGTITNGANPTVTFPAVSDAFTSNTHEKVNTIILSSNIELFPGALDLKLAYSLSWSNEDWDYGPFAAYPLQNNGVGYSPFPTVSTNYQRLDASLRHTIDPSIVAKLGWTGEVYVKGRYIWERNSVDNWQQDLMSPYLYLVDTTLARMIDMGTTNPNYDAQYVQVSLNARW
ncbi:MAG: MtrB/PioB family decaheme-associated outer membrane protein [Pseudomonadota bacterium]